MVQDNRVAKFTYQCYYITSYSKNIGLGILFLGYIPIFYNEYISALTWFYIFEQQETK